MEVSPPQAHSIRNIVQLVQTGKLKSQDGSGYGGGYGVMGGPNHGTGVPASAQQSPEIQQYSGGDENDDKRSETSQSSSKLTSESRWLLIKQLAQRKALKGQHPDQPGGQSISSSVDGPAYSGPNGNGSGPANDYHSTADTDSHLRYGRPTPPSPKYRQQSEQGHYDEQYVKPTMNNNWTNERPRQSASSPMNRKPLQRSHSADPRGSFDNSFNTNSSPRRNLDDGSYNMDDARAFRHAQSVAALHEEVYKEYTFQPKFYTSDVSRSRSKDVETPFYSRVQRWQSQRDADLEARRKMKERLEIDSCSFQPKLNANSLRAALEMRGASGPDATPETMEDVATRLHKAHEESLLLKNSFIQMEEKRVIEEELRACTFKPNTTSTTSSKYSETKPKYHLEHEYKHNKEPLRDPRDKENTFTPRVKGVNANMKSAVVYLSTNVVDRLSRPLSASVDTSASSSSVRRSSATPFDVGFGGNVMDMNAYMGGGGNVVSSSASVGSMGSNRRQSSSANQQHQRTQTPLNTIFRSSFSHSAAEEKQRASSAPKERGTPGTPRLSAEERQERKKNFDEFISRQMTSETKKKIHREEVRYSFVLAVLCVDTRVQVAKWSTPQFKPALNKKSLALARENDQSEFLDRMEKFILKKNDASERRQSVSALADAGCTFQPTLTKKVDGMRARSMHELSQGDSIRRDQKVKVMKARHENEEKQTLTFKPRLSQRGQDKQSVLKLAEDPSQHLQYAKRRLDRRSRDADEAARLKEEHEEKLCTFTPVTKKCPSFIVKIADGMKMIHKAKANSSQADITIGSIRDPSPGRPTWRFT
jgi:hypothetical protein